MKNSIAVIFDMDGVIVDNNSYHKAAWREFLKKYDLQINAEDLIQNVWGRTNEDILTFVFGRPLSTQELEELEEAKESLYREMYKKHIKPVDGLIDFLQDLKNNNAHIGIATSALQNNLDYVLSHIPIRKFFDALTDGSQIKKGKPDPEVYILAAKKLGVPCKNCVAIEDSFSGVNSALAAGMKVIGITTTHTNEELHMTNFNVPDFLNISFKNIAKLFEH